MYTVVSQDKNANQLIDLETFKFTQEPEMVNFAT